MECARHYILTGRSLPEMCESNAAVARSAGRPHVALVWDTIKVQYSYTPSVEETIFTRPDDLLLPESKGVSKVRIDS